MSDFSVDRLRTAQKVVNPARGYIRYVVFLLSVVNIFNYMDRMALSVLLPSIKADLNLSDGQLGLLVGFAFSAFYAVCGIPIARWADRGVRRNIIALALAVWSAMTALSGAAQNFLSLFVARMGVGAGEAGGLPPAQSIICDYVPVKRRSGVFAIHNFGSVAGVMLGMALAGWLGETIGWRWTFVALGLPGIALAVLVRLTLREPVRGQAEVVRESGDHIDESFRETVLILWHCRTYRMLVFFLVVNGFVQYGLTQWWPSFYVRVFGLGMSSVGVYLGIALGVGSGIGVLTGGWLANRFAERDSRLPLITCAAATALALPTALASLFVSSSLGSVLLVSLTGLFWTVQAGPVVATMYSVTMPRMRATAGALSIFAISALGLGLGPFCVGLLSDALTSALGAQALRWALLAPVCLIPVMAMALYAAANTVQGDLKTVGARV